MMPFLDEDLQSCFRVFSFRWPVFPSNFVCLSHCFAPQIIFHKENPGINYEFYVPVEKREVERERMVEREKEAPRERPREREPGRAPLRSTSLLFRSLF